MWEGHIRIQMSPSKQLYSSLMLWNRENQTGSHFLCFVEQELKSDLQLEGCTSMALPAWSCVCVCVGFWPSAFNAVLSSSPISCVIPCGTLQLNCKPSGQPGRIPDNPPLQKLLPGHTATFFLFLFWGDVFFRLFLILFFWSLFVLWKLKSQLHFVWIFYDFPFEMCDLKMDSCGNDSDRQLSISKSEVLKVPRRCSLSKYLGDWSLWCKLYGTAGEHTQERIL